MGKIFLVDQGRHVEELVDRGLKNRGKWIALSPYAMEVLDSLGIPYGIPEDYYTDDEFERECLAQHQRTLEFCRKVDDLFWGEHPHLSKYSIRPFLFSLVPLTILFDGMVGRIFQLQAIARGNPGDTLAAHFSEHEGFGLYGMVFDDKETLYGRLLSLDGWRFERELIPDRQYAPPAKTGLREKAATFVRSSVLLNSLYNFYRARDWAGIWGVISGAGRGRLLITGGDRDWRHVFPLLREAGWKVVYGPGECAPRRSSGGSGIGFIENVPGMIEHFVYGGINFYPLLRPKIARLLETAEGMTATDISDAAWCLKRKNVSAVLASSLASQDEHVFNAIAGWAGLPVINWQHGWIGYYKNIIQMNEYNELMSTTHNLVYGESVREAFDRSNMGRFQSKTIAVGSPMLDSLRAKALKGQARTAAKPLRVLYMPNSFYRNCWYYGFSPPYSDRRLYRDQRGIIEHLSRRSAGGDIEATVKLHPYLFSGGWKAMEGGPVRFIREKRSVDDLMLESDAIVIDVPTTALLQAVATLKPVFVLMRHMRYSDTELGMLKKRAVCANELGELLEKLDAFLDKGVYGADLANETFLRAYGTHLNDGRSAARAAALVMREAGRAANDG